MDARSAFDYHALWHTAMVGASARRRIEATAVIRKPSATFY